MRMLDLFSGIGGFALAAQWVWGDDLDIVSFCEIDPFCQKVLKKHWPDVPCCEDVRKIQGKDYGTIDLISGGFPCQPFSVAGNRRGQNDDRHLWPEMFRIINEVRPRWVVGENVANFVNMELDNSISDLESIGYTCEPFDIPACGVGAKHKRHRCFMVAYPVNGSDFTDRGTQRKADCIQGERGETGHSGLSCRTGCSPEVLADADGKRGRCREAGVEYAEDAWESSGNKGGNRAGVESWNTEPELGRVADGIPNRSHRLRALGNAIVPQVAEVIFRAIKEIDG